MDKEILKIIDNNIELLTLENLKRLKQAETELDNINIEDMTKEDIYFKYVFLGNETKCRKPKVTKALIKYGYIKEALSYVDFLSNKQIIIDLLASKQLKDRKYTVIQGAITNTTIHKEEIKENCNIHNILIEFTSKDKSKVYNFTYLYGNLEDIIEFQYKIKPYKNNIVAIVENENTKQHLLTLVKFYDDIDYKIKK